MSSQAYEEMWPIFFKSWNKYHPKIKIKKYISSSEENFINKKCNFKVVSGVGVIKNFIWSTRIRSDLKRLITIFFFSTEEMNFYKNRNLSLINDFIKSYYNNSLQYL